MIFMHFKIIEQRFSVYFLRCPPFISCTYCRYGDVCIGLLTQMWVALCGAKNVPIKLMTHCLHISIQLLVKSMLRMSFWVSGLLPLLIT